MTSPAPNKWLHRTVQPEARTRLLCFPFGGGSASFYRDWQTRLGPQVEVCAVQLPGREARFAEPFFTDIDQLLPPLAQALSGLFDLPLHLFGYSLGAGIAHRFASYCAEHYPAARIESLTACASSAALGSRVSAAAMSDEQFLAYIQALGGLPGEVADNPGLRAIALRTLRHDFALSESIDLPTAAPVALPILAIGGDLDPSVPVDGLQAWAAKTTEPAQQQVFPGDHFFVRQNLPGVLQALRSFAAV
ncbi:MULTISPECIES: thioesterase II family protein [unclassified Pseudomonas]|uniref:thioesterase II family protein n=1 Tax=unclassified Pseudomonas TaxID=196821 RepID=UPI000BDD5086|nr:MULTISPECIES: thioesterase domain-containing protein [unclassified Pseudomonas]PVZ15401.1 surfactin synthase thioesterase subunit [Pseudomonas sp. URIL14HWK12:I12]PVZ24775.1 surfactin synthase thioesterase subunit [Pseudomonas sp. URIL14HWK12:I10]PVZ34621.1 surfactin synthase thioesterase subunit [Pseudomonas sp. URIL14HWK12:I11]SNZ08801.1 Thioesterase domain-containing protein [Pseudomonas sp. URIL14HWK12:I9]